MINGRSSGDGATDGVMDTRFIVEIILNRTEKGKKAHFKSFISSFNLFKKIIYLFGFLLLFKFLFSISFIDVNVSDHIILKLMGPGPTDKKIHIDSWSLDKFDGVDIII